MTETVTLSLAEANALCERAAIAAGASPLVATSLASSFVSAEADGQRTVGLSHFIDHLDALEAGRIDGKAVPDISSPAPAVILSDARGGAAQPGFDAAFDRLVAAALSFGIAMFTQRNAFTCGSLSYFVGRLAERGLASLIATNGPPVVAGSGSTRPVYCTNPMAFGVTVADAPPLIIDQSSSATAFVNIRAAAEAGKDIPPGWALDSEGRPTTDPNAAMQGALLAFGGNRGANVALMVELLSAGFNRANWSIDAPPFGVGSEGPGTGMTVIAIAPHLIDLDFEARLGAYVSRLAGDYGVHIPGRAKAEARARSQRDGLAIPAAVHQRIAALAGKRR